LQIANENVSEYLRNLIRRDKERVEREAFDRLKAELYGINPSDQLTSRSMLMR